MPPNLQPEWLKVQEAAKVANVSRDTIDAAVRSGELAASDIGRGRYRILRIARTDLAAWLRSKQVRTVAAVSVETVKAKWSRSRTGPSQAC